MNETKERPAGNRMAGALDDIFGPVHAPHGTLERKLLAVRAVVAYAGLLTTLVQVVVWLTIGVMSSHLDTPWWLWTTVPAVAVAAVLTVMERWHRWWTSTSTRIGAGR